MINDVTYMEDDRASRIAIGANRISIDAGRQTPPATLDSCIKNNSTVHSQLLRWLERARYRTVGARLLSATAQASIKGSVRRVVALRLVGAWMTGDASYIADYRASHIAIGVSRSTVDACQQTPPVILDASQELSTQAPSPASDNESND